MSKLYIPDGALVADVTFGQGSFWKKCATRRFTVVGSDLIKPNGQLRADCRQLPYRAESFDVVALDPPYVHNSQPRHFHHRRFGGGMETALKMSDVINLYGRSMAEARRVLRPGGRLLVKTMDQVCGGKQVWVHVDLLAVAEELGMFGRDLFVLAPDTVPPHKHGKQIHARKAHSFLWVFER